MARKYTPKFNPGKHYSKAHEAIASKEYGVVGVADNGDWEGTGTIAKSQVEALLSRNLELTEVDKFGCRDFLLPYEEFEELTEFYRELKDEYIVENKLEIEGL